MQNEPYNLLRERWIPVALDDGRRVSVRPCDICEPYDGHAIVRIATGRPDCDISLTEFLIGLLAVTMPPENSRDWLKRYRNPPKRSELQKAFALVEAAMNLDGDGPTFFQDFEEFEGRIWPCASLFCDAPGDKAIKENADHFIKRGRYSQFSRAGAAVALLTLQSVAPAGGAGQYSALRGPGPLTTIVLPASRTGEALSLWDMLWANVPTGFGIKSDDLAGVFPWLQKTRTAAEAGITTPDNTHIAHCFFGMPRRVKLIFSNVDRHATCDLLGGQDDRMISSFTMKSGGTNYEGWARVSPFTPVYKSTAQQQLRSTQLRSSRVGYRQWLGMVVYSSDGVALPAKVIPEFARRAVDLSDIERKSARIFAAGFVFKPGQATALDFGEALMPLIITGDSDSDDRVRAFAEGFVKAADLIAKELSASVKCALFGKKAKTDPSTTVVDAVRQRFWGDTEQAFYAALRRSAEMLVTNKDGAGERLDELRQAGATPWLAAMRKTALAIFDDTAPIEDAESSKIKDVIEGRRMLVLSVRGYGPVGAQIFAALGLPAVETKAKKGRKAV